MASKAKARIILVQVSVLLLSTAAALATIPPKEDSRQEDSGKGCSGAFKIPADTSAMVWGWWVWHVWAGLVDVITIWTSPINSGPLRSAGIKEEAIYFWSDPGFLLLLHKVPNSALTVTPETCLV